MNIKINVINDRFTKISPMAFGSLFANLSEYVEDETPEKTFENMGVFVGKTIVDYEGTEYKVMSISKMNQYENRSNETTYKVDVRRL